MPQSYSDGQRLKGSDGQIYIMHNGVPVLESSVAPAAARAFGTPDPTQPYKAPRAAADTARAQAEADPILLKAQRDRAVAEARKATVEADLAAPTDAPVLAGKVNGDAFLKTISPQDAAIAKGVADGRIAFPSGAALRSPYWQKVLTNVVNYDPNFDAINYNSRAATRKDFTSGKSSMNIKALNTAIGHVGELWDQIGGTTSFGGNDNALPGATALNSLGNAYERSRGASGITNYEQTAGAVASELTQVFRGTGGAEADVKRYLGELNSNASMDQKQGAARNIMKLLKSRLDAIGDQYTKGMGTTAQPLNLLDDHAQKVWNAVGGGAASGGNGAPPAIGSAPPSIGPGGGGTPPTGGSPPSPQSNPLNYAQDQYGDSTTTQVAGATKSIPNELGIKFMGGLNALFHSGASDERIRAYASQFGVDPSAQLAYRKANPGFRGSIPPVAGGLSINVPVTDAMSQVANAMAGSPVGTGIGEAGNAAGAGIPQWTAAQLSGNPDLARARFGVARSMNPRSAISGELIGGTLGAIGGETAALKGAGALGKLGGLGEGAMDALNFGARRVADATYGGVSGATGALPGQEGSGALKGALAGVGGGMLGEGAGRYALEPATRPVGRLFGAPMAPGPADNALFKAVGSNGPDINAQLGEASGLGLPMTLADTNPALRSLAGAAVRRSPNASGVAENVLLPRNRGQIDRLGSAVARDLGPIDNIPQLQDNLIKSARAKAGPLYDQAYAAPPVASEQVNALLNTPFGKSSLGEAMNIAKNERVDPSALSVDFNRAGEASLKRVPNMRTLDLTKRGMDTVLEKYRDPVTRRLNLSGNEGAQAENGVRSDFLKELDRINPAYAQARAAYAGPAAERDFINTGQDAFSAVPDQLKFNMQNVPADKMPMVQSGYRDALMQRANSARFASNPYDATLGTPAAEARLQTVYPEGNGPANLLRQRDLERQMQATSNDILGNSKTAQRGIADEAFTGEDLPQIALDTGLNLMTGQVPIGTMVKVGMGQSMRDALKFGVGKRAVKKADILAPTLLNPDPAASSAELADVLARSQGYRDYIARRRGIFGAPLGMAGSGLLTGYSTAQ